MADDQDGLSFEPADFETEAKTVLEVCAKADRLAGLFQEEASTKHGDEPGMVASA